MQLDISGNPVRTHVITGTICFNSSAKVYSFSFPMRWNYLYLGFVHKDPAEILEGAFTHHVIGRRPLNGVGLYVRNRAQMGVAWD